MGDGDTACEKEIKQHYKIQGVIGKGTFATVRLGKHRTTEEQVAVKIMSKRKMSKEDQEAVKQEIDILNSLSHPNIVEMKEHFEDDGHYCLVMELMNGGELFDMIIEKGHFNETEANKVMTPLFDAVIAAHKEGIVHRDLKPENLLLSDKDLSKATVKISDFGLARYVCPE
jgi:serine/threonine protein kinase